MTTPRRSQIEETPFGNWVRNNPSLEAHQHSLTVTDADWIFHKYRATVDGISTRDVQLAMLVETKTFGRTPTKSQQETLFYHHQLLNRKGKVNRVMQPEITLWHFGVYVLRMDSSRPDENSHCLWGRFGDGGTLTWMPLDQATLTQVLRFDRRPDDPRQDLSLRRHHKTRELVVLETMPLGFHAEKKVLRRS